MNCDYIETELRSSERCRDMTDPWEQSSSVRWLENTLRRHLYAIRAVRHGHDFGNRYKGHSFEYKESWKNSVIAVCCSFGMDGMP